MSDTEQVVVVKDSAVSVVEVGSQGSRGARGPVGPPVFNSELKPDRVTVTPATEYGMTDDGVAHFDPGEIEPGNEALMIFNRDGSPSLIRPGRRTSPGDAWATRDEVAASIGAQTIVGLWSDMPDPVGLDRLYFAKDVGRFYAEDGSNWRPIDNVFHVADAGHKGDGSAAMDAITSAVNKAKLAGGGIVRFAVGGSYLLEKPIIYDAVTNVVFDMTGALLYLMPGAAYIPFSFNPNCDNVNFWKGTLDGGSLLWAQGIDGTGTSFIQYRGTRLRIEEVYAKNWGRHFIKDGTQIAGDVPHSPLDVKNARSMIINNVFENMEMIYLSEVGANRQTRYSGNHHYHTQGGAKYVSDVQGGVNYPREVGMHIHSDNTYSECGKMEGFLTNTATGGTFRLRVMNSVTPSPGVSTADLPFNASYVDIQAALEGLSNVGVGKVLVGRYHSDATRTAISFSPSLRDVDIVVENGSAPLTGGVMTWIRQASHLCKIQGAIWGLLHHDEIVDDFQNGQILSVASNTQGPSTQLIDAGGNIISHDIVARHLWNCEAARFVNSSTKPFYNVHADRYRISDTTHGVLNLNSGIWIDWSADHWTVEDWSKLGDGTSTSNITRRAMRIKPDPASRGIRVGWPVFRRSAGANRFTRSSAVYVNGIGIAIRIVGAIYSDINNVNNDAIHANGDATTKIIDTGGEWSDGNVAMTGGVQRVGWYMDAGTGDFVVLQTSTPSGMVIVGADGSRFRISAHGGGSAGGIDLIDVPAPVFGNGGDDGVDDPDTSGDPDEGLN